MKTTTAQGRGKKVLIAAIVFFVSWLAGFFAWSVFRHPVSKTIADPPETGVKTGGYTVVLSEQEQAADGITAEPVKPVRYARRIEAYGTVLQPDPLFRARDIYVSAMASLERAQAEFLASKKEYARLKALNENAKNVSDRDVEAAGAALASARANVDNARWSLQGARDEINLEWGGAISKWIFNFTPQYQGVVSNRDVLVRVTLSPAEALRGIAREIIIQSPGGRTAPAKFMARSKETDPRIQGPSFIYMAPSRPAGLIPGMNVAALFPSGKSESGFFVPFSAVVWLQDKAWVYIKKTGTGFSRVEVPASASSQVNGGYFVSDIFSAGDRIVAGPAISGEHAKGHRRAGRRGR
ncbi:MAG: hypothetical protein M0Z75_14320 [Nitrospiraceae bacterium]|nr:hypothetical protein [Nitrospiraceae bacterium]